MTLRRPLFQYGYPVQLADATTVDAFDASQFSQEETYAVTLYVWARPAVPGNVSALTVLLISPVSPAPGLPVVNMDAAALTAQRPANAGSIKALDRFLMRGDQQLVVRRNGDDPLWVWGFFERVGQASKKPEYRPLQPTNDLVAPYNAPVFSQAFVAGVAPPVEEVLHLLDTREGRSDLFTLDFVSQYAADGGPQQDGNAVLVFPNGVEMSLGLTNGGDGILQRRIFDEQPMVAHPSGGEIQARVVPDTLEATLFIAYGRFTRQ